MARDGLATPENEFFLSGKWLLGMADCYSVKLFAKRTLHQKVPCDCFGHKKMGVVIFGLHGRHRRVYKHLLTDHQAKVKFKKCNTNHKFMHPIPLSNQFPQPQATTQICLENTTLFLTTSGYQGITEWFLGPHDWTFNSVLESLATIHGILIFP